MKWVVQRFDGIDTGPRNDWPTPMSPRWVDIEPYKNGCWEAADAGGAFNLAVLQNANHRLNGTSYRVLPFDGGMTFDLRLNVEGREHDKEPATP
jgi:hypothetical protein